LTRPRSLALTRPGSPAGSPGATLIGKVEHHEPCSHAKHAPPVSFLRLGRGRGCAGRSTGRPGGRRGRSPPPGNRRHRVPGAGGPGPAFQAWRPPGRVDLPPRGTCFRHSRAASLSPTGKQVPDKARVTDKTCFLGSDAYQRVIDRGVDGVLIAPPPAFHAPHL